MSLPSTSVLKFGLMPSVRMLRNQALPENVSASLKVWRAMKLKEGERFAVLSGME